MLNPLFTYIVTRLLEFKILLFPGETYAVQTTCRLYKNNFLVYWFTGVSFVGFDFCWHLNYFITPFRNSFAFLGKLLFTKCLWNELFRWNDLFRDTGFDNSLIHPIPHPPHAPFSDHFCCLGRVPYGIRRYSTRCVRHGTITHVGTVQQSRDVTKSERYKNRSKLKETV